MKLRNKNEGYFQLVHKVLSGGKKGEEQGKNVRLKIVGKYCWFQIPSS
jgi:hypothetical protein